MKKEPGSYRWHNAKTDLFLILVQSQFVQRMFRSVGFSNKIEIVGIASGHQRCRCQKSLFASTPTHIHTFAPHVRLESRISNASFCCKPIHLNWMSPNRKTNRRARAKNMHHTEPCTFGRSHSYVTNNNFYIGFVIKFVLCGI